MQNYKTLSLALGAIILVATTAAASVYLSKPQPAPAEKVAVVHRPRAEQPAQQVMPKCNDGNVAGKAVGGVGGGVIGSLAGKGNGKTAATIAGTLGGAYLGGEVIPLQNVTCR